MTTRVLSTMCTRSSRLHQKCFVPTKEQGQAHLPHPEIIPLTCDLSGKGFQREAIKEVESLKVGKAGLPPLFSVLNDIWNVEPT